ncbi:MAG: BrnT family toxin [Rhodobacteraceae bacterium]|nr:BrnT family toxin [Paracoccaceae bacterium]MYG43341.1 BrnT family toxin [Paracoccaceae bacterium]
MTRSGVQVPSPAPFSPNMAVDTKQRWITLGELNGVMVMVSWTWRGPRIRIISARRLREDEKRRYQDNDP